MKVFSLIFLTLFSMALSQASTAKDSDFPQKPIQLVVGYAAGGAVDAVARKVGAMLSEQSGWQVVVENRPGASGNIAAAYVARAPADGHTLILAPSTLLANPLVSNTKSSFDLKTDLTSVSLVASGPLMMLGPLSGPSTVKEFIKGATAKPEDFNFGTGGFGSASHLATEFFKQNSGIKDVPVILYRGTAAAMTDIISGRLSATMEPMLSAAPQIAGGKVKALAITSARRNPLFPDVPTFAEIGFPEMQFQTWYGIWGPAKLPEPVMQALRQAFNHVLGMPQFESWALQQGYEPTPLMGPALTDFLKNEFKRYESIVRAGNIQPQ